VAEVGRQPWVIHEQMTTATAAMLPARRDGIVLLATFGIAYAVIAVLVATVVVWLVRAGPRRLAWPWSSWWSLPGRPRPPGAGRRRPAWA
jgi:cytochrome bd-type quinol oxidase subunit 1